ncbi:MAG TPA: fibronectin type III domain-containing protein [Ignavibacteria bacterium]|nr:fibronectin type III domain-containing protein [Ignavibacteria bacterium]HMQ99039.1 fibronectin type III domain-containing protein [Ignavibacteria bacterium]
MRSSPETTYNKVRHRKTKSISASPIVLNAAGGDLKGEIHLMWEPCKNARYYLVQKSSSICKPARWKYEDIIFSSSYTVSNLKSHKNYMFRVAAMTETGKTPWSRPVLKKAP